MLHVLHRRAEALLAARSNDVSYNIRDSPTESDRKAKATRKSMSSSKRKTTRGDVFLYVPNIIGKIRQALSARVLDTLRLFKSASYGMELPRCFQRLANQYYVLRFEFCLRLL